jgi:hypothetical protein
MINFSKTILVSLIATVIQNMVSFLLLFFVTTHPATFWGLLVCSGIIIWFSVGFYLNNYKESLISSSIFNLLLLPMLFVLFYVFTTIAEKLVLVVNIDVIFNISTLDALKQSLLSAFVITLVVFIITSVISVSSSLFRSRVLDYQGTTSIDQSEAVYYEKYETSKEEGEYSTYEDEEFE